MENLTICTGLGCKSEGLIQGNISIDPSTNIAITTVPMTPNGSIGIIAMVVFASFLLSAIWAYQIKKNRGGDVVFSQNDILYVLLSTVILSGVIMLGFTYLYHL